MKKTVLLPLLLLSLPPALWSGQPQAQQSPAAANASQTVTEEKPPVTSPQLALAFAGQYQPAGAVSFARWQQQGRQLLGHSLLLADRRAVISSRQRLPALQGVSASQQAGAHSVERWLIEHYQSVVALVLRPAKLRAGPLNAILLLHDHGAEFRIGKDKWLSRELSIQPELSHRWQQKYFAGVALAHRFADAGFLVLVADAPGFGERGALRYDEQQQLAANLLAQGGSLAGLMAREDQALARLLAAEPGVRGVAAVGFSMGAMRALQLAALSPDVAAAVAVGWFDQLSSLRQSDNNFSRGQSSFYLLHPGLYQQLDVPDLVALAAPKPLLLLMGTGDPLMPKASVQQAFDRLAALYQACGSAAARLSWQQGQGHRFGLPAQQQTLDFLTQERALVSSCQSLPSVSN